MKEIIVFWILVESITSPVPTKFDDFGMVKAQTYVTEKKIDTLCKTFNDLEDFGEFYGRLKERKNYLEGNKSTFGGYSIDPFVDRYKIDTIWIKKR